jgi:hypothetical protein
LAAAGTGEEERGKGESGWSEGSPPPSSAHGGP